MDEPRGEVLNDGEFADLIGQKFTDRGRCWGAAHTVLARMGIDVPPTQAEAMFREKVIGETLPANVVLRRGDVVVMKGSVDGNVAGLHVGVALDPFTVLHVGVALDPFTVLHATEQKGLTPTRLATIKKAGAFVRAVRPGVCPRGGCEPVEWPKKEAGADGVAMLSVLSDPFDPTHRVDIPVPVRAAGMSVADFVWCAIGRVADPAGVAVLIDGDEVPVEKREGTLVRSGQRVLITPKVHGWDTVIWAAIAVVSSLASGLLAGKPKLKAADRSDTPRENRFGYRRRSVETFLGDTVPVVSGERTEHGGKIVSVITRENAEGTGGQTMKVLVLLGVGPFAAIANQTADFTNLDASAVSGIQFNDQPIASFPKCKVSGRLGTMDQEVMPGFDDVETIREVGSGGVDLRNTSGSDRTGGSASGEAFTFSTVDAVNAVVVRVRFARGLYTTSAQAQLEPRRARWRARWRTSDIGAGAGSWSAWTVYAPERADQSEVFSSPRIDVASGGAGSAVKVDVQVERVTKEPTDALTVDDMKWDSIIEVIDTENNYAGYAVLGLDLVASEQLTDVPAIATHVIGLANLRRWDGVSDPSSPTFTTGSSSNPADLALELITSKTWGMGYLYSDANVDFASLFEFRTRCAESVACVTRAGTRPRHTCNLVIDEVRSGEEWLRAICAAARCVPVLAGNVWRFIYDGPRSTASEVFTDASVAVKDDGTGFTYQREWTKKGINRVNQIELQFEDAAAGGGTGTVRYPEDGELWLVDEDTNARADKLEGVTDADEVYCHAVYLGKRERLLERAVSFETTRPVVNCIPGERVDVAYQLPGWGLASGRVMEGCTAGTLRLDRTVTLAPATVYQVRVVFADGSTELRVLDAAAGTYAAGAEIALATPLTHAPARFDEYALGEEDITTKPFIVEGVELVDVETRRWRIDATEYNASVYTADPADLRSVRYSSLGQLSTPPGPVKDLRVFEVYETEPGAVNPRATVKLSWAQEPGDAAVTATFKLYRRTQGTLTWLLIPTATVATRGAVLEVIDVDRTFEFAAVAVSANGNHLSPDDARVPKVLLVFGQTSPPPDAPGGVTITQAVGNTYTLSWDAVEGATGYQVLACGASSGRPNAGAENALVVARTIDPELTGLELSPGLSAKFWVRSVGINGRLSFTPSSVTLTAAATPPGETVVSDEDLDLSADGTRTNCSVSGGVLKATSAGTDAVYLSDEITLSGLLAVELTVKPTTSNQAADPVINTDPFTAPSIAADQWGIISTGPKVVGMLMPPWPDDEQSWTTEARLYDGTAWGSWRACGYGQSISGMASKYQVRCTMKRKHAPYLPGLSGLRVVVTA